MMQIENVIKELAHLFEVHNISYHFDASTSVYIHGIHFEMDDIDIVFMYHEKQKVRKLFGSYKMSETQSVPEIGLEYFFVQVGGQQVHCLFYDSSQTMSKEVFNKDAEVLVLDGQVMMVQSLAFYLKYSKDKQNLKARIEAHLSQR